MTEALIPFTMVIIGIGIALLIAHFFQKYVSHKQRDLISTVDTLTGQVRTLIEDSLKSQQQISETQSQLISTQLELLQLKHDFTLVVKGSMLLITQLLEHGIEPIWNLPADYRQDINSINSSDIEKLKQVKELVERSFNEDELAELAFSLDINWERVEGQQIGRKILEFLLLIKRLGKLNEFMSLVKKVRPNLAWPY